MPVGHICLKILLYKAAISLRWHYPNQVMGPGHTSRSQPACASSPFVFITIPQHSMRFNPIFLILSKTVQKNMHCSPN